MVSEGDGKRVLGSTLSVNAASHVVKDLRFTLNRYVSSLKSSLF